MNFLIYRTLSTINVFEYPRLFKILRVLIPSLPLYCNEHLRTHFFIDFMEISMEGSLLFTN